MRQLVQTTGALRSNMLAPRWQGSLQPGDVPDCYQEKARDYVIALSVPTAAPVLGQTLRLDGDGDFVLRAFRYIRVFAPGGFPAVRIRWPDGSYLCDDWLWIPEILGPVYPPKTVPAGGEISFDFQVVDPGGAGTLTGQFIMRGVTRWHL